MNEQEIESIDDIKELDDLRKKYSEERKFKELLLVCKRALVIEPEDYDFSWALAWALYQTKEYGKAMRLSKKILQESDSEMASLTLGLCYLRINSYTKAIEIFKELLDEYPNMSEFSAINYLLGLAHKEQSKQDKDLSVKYINQAKLLEPEIESNEMIKEFLEFFQ